MAQQAVLLQRMVLQTLHQTVQRLLDQFPTVQHHLTVVEHRMVRPIRTVHRLPTVGVHRMDQQLRTVQHLRMVVEHPKETR